MLCKPFEKWNVAPLLLYTPPEEMRLNGGVVRCNHDKFEISVMFFVPAVFLWFGFLENIGVCTALDFLTNCHLCIASVMCTRNVCI